MRSKFVLAFACFALAAPAKAQDIQVLTGCIDDLSGHACLLTPPEKVRTDADYGAIYVQISPPTSVTEQAVKAGKRNWKNWIGRFFMSNTKSGALIAEVYQGSNKIAIIPVSMFSIDERKGLKIESSNAFVDMQQATPYFALDTDSNPIRVILTYRSSRDQSSNILGTFNKFVSVATGFGVSGFLVSAGLNTASAALKPIEQDIANNFDTNGDSKLELGFSFEKNAGADFTFGFDPSKQDRSGRITFQLVRRASIFGDFPFADQRPLFPFRGRTDVGSANDLLLRQLAGKKVRAQLQAASSGQFDRLQQVDIKPADFEAVCSVVEAAVLAQGTNSHDVAAMMWASLMSAGGILRADLRETNCLKKWMGTFAVYGLKLPEPSQAISDSTDQSSDVGRGTVVDPKPGLADLSEPALRTFMSALFQIMAQSDSSEVRVRAYQSMLSLAPHPTIDLDPDFGLAALDESANARFVAEKLSALSFRSGCFVRQDDKSISFLARLVSPSVSTGQPLWLMNLRLESQRKPATANSSAIGNWSMRMAKIEDMTLFATAFPGRTGCADYALAPN